MTNTYALDHDHPMHPYNQIKEQGLRPEDFGINHPLAEEFDNMSRADLIAEVLSLRKEIEAMARAGF